MADLSALQTALAPVLEVVAELNLEDTAAAKSSLEQALPLDDPRVARIRELVRQGVRDGWLCDREGGPGVSYSRVQKSADGGLSVDAVHMTVPGPGHTHPQGEVDLCFAVDGAPRFDGQPEGWTVYPPGSWHVPTVDGGAMDILYFLPAGAIQFGPKPG